MIAVRFSIDKESASYNMRLSGHAGAAQKGQDIVCSAASILAYTVAQVAKLMHERGFLECEPLIELGDGDATISMRPTAEGQAEVQHTLFVARTGYSLLAHNYPQYVELT